MSRISMFTDAVKGFTEEHFYKYDHILQNVTKILSLQTPQLRM